MLGLFAVSMRNAGLFSNGITPSNAIGVFVIPFLACIAGIALGLAAYFVCRRSAAAFNLALSALLCLGIFILLNSPHGGAPATPSSNNQTTVNEMNRISGELKDRTRRQREGKQGPLTGQDVEDYAKRLDDLASKATGNDALVAKASAQLARSIGGAGTRVTAAIRKFNDAGAIRPETILEKGDLDHRAALLDDLEAANNEYQRILATAPESLAQVLRDGNIPEASCTETAAAFRRSAGLQKFVDLCSIRHRRYGADRECLSVVSDNWGHFTRQGDRFIFDDAMSGAAYDAALKKVELAAVQERDWFGANGAKPPSDSAPTNGNK